MEEQSQVDHQGRATKIILQNQLIHESVKPRTKKTQFCRYMCIELQPLLLNEKLEVLRCRELSFARKI